MTYETIIKITLSLVYESLVVVAERKTGKVAVEVKHDIAIDVHEIIALALLGVDEPLDLNISIIILYLVSMINVI